MSGITAEGFERKTLEEIDTAVNQRLLDDVDPGTDLSSDSPLGQIVAAVDDEIAEVWEVAEAAYEACDPNKAEGSLLDNVGALRGIPRNPATKSQVPVTLNLNSSALVAAGKIISVESQPNIRFELVADVASTTAGTYPGLARCLVTGPVVANAGTLTHIDTPVSGWNSVTNATDAAVGTNVETDTAYRVRQGLELARPGTNTTEAIRADVLEVAGVQECSVFENVELTTDSDGVPGKSFETVIWDGDLLDADNDEVIAAIRANKTAGIKSWGTSVTGTFTDAHGNPVTIRFTRATKKTVYLTLSLTTNSDYDIVDGPAAVKAALVAYGNMYGMGADVVALAVRAAALTVAGVVDVPTFTLGFGSSPVGTSNLTIGSREIARFDTARVTIV